MDRHTINHCRLCGGATRKRLPDDGDTRERAVCEGCGAVHYVNPLLVVGTLPCLGEQVLLCRRAIEPRRGKWTLPAGFMELGESMAAGAARETAEEAGAPIEMGALFCTVSLPRVGQVHVFYLARLLAPRWNPGPESLEVRLFTERDLPWDELAFATVRTTLERYFSDRAAGRMGMHDLSID